MKTVKPDGMADAIMEELNKYSKVAASDMKKAINEAGKTAKKEIEKNAPKRTGRYKKSLNTIPCWTCRATGTILKGDG